MRPTIHHPPLVSSPGVCLAIGAFDGVHLGHQSVVGAMVRRARMLDLSAMVLTFDPVPKVAFGRAKPVSILAQRVARLYALGVDVVHAASFTPEYASRSAASFIDDLLQQGVEEVHVGEDFRFGYQRQGDIELLAKCFRIVTAKGVLCPAGDRISSTRIRDLRAAGRHEAANALLGLVPNAHPSLAGQMSELPALEFLP